MKIDFKKDVSAALEMRLIKNGLPRNFWTTKSFTLASVVRSFTSDVEGLKPVSLSAKEQITEYTKLIKKPLRMPLIYCIASKPNDQIAKVLGAMVMAHATAVYSEKSSKAPQIKEHPLWHTVTGSFGDSLLDKRNTANPSMLILSNIMATSTNQKLEKVRDLLETYSAIPRIVLVAGMDPITFFNTKLMYPLNGAFFACKDNVLKEHHV